MPGLLLSGALAEWKLKIFGISRLPPMPFRIGTAADSADRTSALKSGFFLLAATAETIAAVKFDDLTEPDNVWPGTFMPMTSSIARIVFTKFCWTVQTNMDRYTREKEHRKILTSAVVWGVSSVHDRLVDSFDGKCRGEVGVQVSKGGHDGGPHKSTVIIRLRLFDRIGPSERRAREDDIKNTYVELDVAGAPSSKLLVSCLNSRESVMVKDGENTGSFKLSKPSFLHEADMSAMPKGM